MIDEKFLKELADPKKTFIKDEDCKMHYYFRDRNVVNPCESNCPNKDRKDYPIEIIYDYGEDEVYTACCESKFSVKSFHRALYGFYTRGFERCHDYFSLQKRIYEQDKEKRKELRITLKENTKVIISKKTNSLDLIIVHDAFTKQYHDLCQSINKENKNKFIKLLKNERFIKTLRVKSDLFFSSLNPFFYSFAASESFYLIELLKVLPSNFIDLQIPKKIGSLKFLLNNKKRQDSWIVLSNASWKDEGVGILKDKNVNYRKKDNLYYQARYELFSNVDFVEKDTLDEPLVLNNISFYKHWKNVIHNHYISPELIHESLMKLCTRNITEDQFDMVSYLIKNKIIDLNEEFFGISHGEMIKKRADDGSGLDFLKLLEIQRKFDNQNNFLNSIK